MLTHLSSIHVQKKIEEVENIPLHEQVRIGVLALQGAFREHCLALYAVGAKPVEIRGSDDMENLHGLCLPGGESTVMAKLLVQNAMLDRLVKLIQGNMPVFATCAGLILLSNEIIGFEEQARLRCLDIAVNRNAFGRQKESFTEELDIICPCFSEKDTEKHCVFPAVFIRAPQIAQAGGNVKILAQRKGRILAVQEKNIVATAFHPELTENLLFHTWLFEKAKEYKASL